MKSYNHLWEKLISDENLLLAINNAAKGKMKRRKLMDIKRNAHYYIFIVRDWIINYRPIHHKKKLISDRSSGKIRSIIVPTIQEHIVQHAVMNILKPIFMKGMYEHTYASIPGRGCHKGMRTIRKWISNDKCGVKYCLKLDIKQYFNSICQNSLMCMLKKKIHDDRFISLLLAIISTTQAGIPLGFYTSQWFANFLLQDLDHYIKEKLRVKHYIRYMDDMVIFGSNKRKLHSIKQAIENYLSKLGLKLKENWQVFRFHTKNNRGRFLDFMGFRFYRNRVTLRRRIALKAMRKARHINKKKYATIHDARQMLTYIGWTRCTDVYNWFKQYISAFVDFRKLRKIVSKYDKKVVKKKCGTKLNRLISPELSIHYHRKFLFMSVVT